MKAKNTLILLILAAGLLAFIFFYERKLPSTDEAAEESRHLVAVDPDRIDGISITNNEDRIELRRSGAQWAIESPVKDRADSAVVNQLLSDIAELPVADSFGGDGKSAGNPSLEELGLENSAVRIKLLGKGAPPEILFGKDAASEGKMYARLDSSKKVYVVSNRLKAGIQKKADDFRDRKLLNFEGGLVTRFNIKSSNGEIEMVRDRGGWFLEKPLKARGDSTKISDLIAQTVKTHIDTFETGANLDAYGLNEPHGTISFTLEGDKVPVVLQIGQAAEKDKSRSYAKLSNRDSFYTVTKKIEDILTIKPNDVRDRHLLNLNFDTVDRIHIQSADKPEITLIRKQEEWVLKNSTESAANGMLVKNLMFALQKEQIAAFVTDVPSDLAKYGLEKPNLKVTFASYASENTAESMAGETAILTVAFGNAEGDLVYARLENEPCILSVHRAVLDAIPADPVAWQGLDVFKIKPGDIMSIDQERDGRTTSLARSPNTSWKLLGGSGELNKIAAESIQNTLATLHAVRWTGSSTAGLGFENPTLVISFSTAQKSARLTVGNPNSSQMWNAKIDEMPGAFIVSAPDYEILHSNLTTPAKPAGPAPVGSSARGGVQ